MRTINLIAVMVAMVLISACCDKEKHDKIIPPNVVAAFHADYPMAENEQWEKACSGDYDVWFSNDGKSKEATYDAEGKQLEYGNELETTLLPQDVLDYIATEYDGYTIKEASEFWKDKEHYYVVFLYQEDYAAKLIFDNGNKLVDKYKWNWKEKWDKDDEWDKEKEWDKGKEKEWDKDKKWDKEWDKDCDKYDKEKYDKEYYDKDGK